MNMSKFADPNNLNAYLTLGKSYMRVRSYEDAIRILRGALIVFPEDPQLYLLLALCHEKAGNTKLAIHNARRSYKLYSKIYDAQGTLETKKILAKYMNSYSK